MPTSFRREASQPGASQVRRVVRVAVGNALEMYDFQIFGYYAPAIGAAFFPNRNPFVSLMLSFMTFGAGFLMRPLGAGSLPWSCWVW